LFDLHTDEDWDQLENGSSLYDEHPEGFCHPCCGEDHGSLGCEKGIHIPDEASWHWFRARVDNAPAEASADQAVRIENNKADLGEKRKEDVIDGGGAEKKYCKFTKCQNCSQLYDLCFPYAVCRYHEEGEPSRVRSCKRARS